MEKSSRSSESESVCDQRQEDNEDSAFVDNYRLLASLLSNKDVKLEHFLQELVQSEFSVLQSPPQSKSSGSINISTNNLHAQANRQNKTFDELQSDYTERLGLKISGLSSVLWHRVSPVVQTLLNQKLRSALEAQLATVVHSEQSSVNLVQNYQTLFREFTHSPVLSFQTGNAGALKRVSPRDYWVLQYFALATCRRSRGDQCLQIGLSGRTSVGKSTLFEAPLIETVHQYLSDSGCGRFKLDSKPVLFFHDIDIHDIVLGRDRDLIKTLARGEPTKSKVHSTTAPIPPVHLFYTSNTKLFNHKVEIIFADRKEASIVVEEGEGDSDKHHLKREWRGSNNSRSSQSQVPEAASAVRATGKRKKLMAAAASAVGQLQIPLMFGTMMMMSSSSAAAAPLTNKPSSSSNSSSNSSSSNFAKNKIYQRHLSEIVASAKNVEHINAVRARFLECYCHTKPKLSTHLFPTTGTFQRHHMICGIYSQVLDLLESTYSSSDFASLGLPLYVLSGLAKNAHLYALLVLQQQHQLPSQKPTTVEEEGVSTCQQEQQTPSEVEKLTLRLLALADAYFPESSHPEEYNSIVKMLYFAPLVKTEPTSPTSSQEI
jgi:hypothetical protein